MNNKCNLKARTDMRNFLHTAKVGVYRAAVYPVNRATFLTLLLLDALFCAWVFWPHHKIPALYGLAFIAALLVFLFVAILASAFVGHIPGALEMQQNFERVGFVNAAGEAPYLIEKERLKNGVVAFTYYCTGFPLELWADKQIALESALNMRIASVHDGKDCRTTILHCVPPDYAFKALPWNDEYVQRNDDEYLVLGRSLVGDVVVNINKTPHILIGGNTGSGKSVLLKCLLWQAVLQADAVYVADFKGGVDYGKNWCHFLHIITSENELLELLIKLADELEHRKILLRKAGAVNITEYRKVTGEYMQRIVFGCDEIAELLDKTGADKERKELLSKIEARLSLIARQGRAFGIHLILATQRPDANILSGQIKNNMNIRICGRADATLSTIIIGDGRAAERIPPDSQGRFITDEGTLFQGFYFEEPSEKEKITETIAVKRI